MCLGSDNASSRGQFNGKSDWQVTRSAAGLGHCCECANVQSHLQHPSVSSRTPSKVLRSTRHRQMSQKMLAVLYGKARFGFETGVASKMLINFQQCTGARPSASMGTAGERRWQPTAAPGKGHRRGEGRAGGAHEGLSGSRPTGASASSPRPLSRSAGGTRSEEQAASKSLSEQPWGTSARDSRVLASDSKTLAPARKPPRINGNTQRNPLPYPNTTLVKIVVFLRQSLLKAKAR